MNKTNFELNKFGIKQIWNKQILIYLVNIIYQIAFEIEEILIELPKFALAEFLLKKQNLRILEKHNLNKKLCYLA